MHTSLRYGLLGAAFVITFSLGWLAATPERISTSDVLLASRLIGLSFSQPERDSMLSELHSYRNAYDTLRKYSPSYPTAPALVFSPLPVGYVPPQGPAPFVLSPLGRVVLPADSNELAYMSLRQLAELIRTRQITSTALTRFYLNRLRRYNPTLLCVVTLTTDSALAQAARADAEIQRGRYRGPLHGIPYGAKDLFAFPGYPTTWGAAPYRNQQLATEATVLQKLHQAGAVLCAKLTLGELAMGDTWFGGKTRNPWNTALGSSGSSAGSASAVSAGLLPFALGTETLGSIVSPSTVCGVTGLRPTFGRVSRAGAMALSWTMDKVGPICRNAEDAIVVLQAIQGRDAEDPATLAANLAYDHRKPLSGMKIGYSKSEFEAKYGFRSNDSAALAQLRALGAQLIPVQLPRHYDIDFLLVAEGAAAFDQLTRSHQDSLLARQGRNAWPNYFRSARFIPAVEYIQANRKRSELIAQMHAIMQQVDVVLVPSWGENLTLTNLTGHPSITVPTGLTARGTPSSISIIGRLFDEGSVVTVARHYQQATTWHLQRPKL